ncbi:hypothetical protein PanWU01x14_156540 [Parasponia andersonii]|uniref:Uncharacterized protein n=1 Tax=Parasponia andersonii TaxID=3476 RepID=A0A2P5CG11_PARAD|nr:hypothetical protein PanWU01x14_156540 [Parasponia andersonii]
MKRTGFELVGGNSQITKVGQLDKDKARETLLSGANLTFVKDMYLHLSTNFLDLDGKRKSVNR